jgi:ABC-type lipoprotein export system ATPase subunit
VVTHSDQTARRADRVVHLRDGRIVGGAEGEEAA